MADNDQDQPDKPQPLTRVAEWIRDAAREVGDVIRPMMTGSATDIEADRSGQLPPSHTPMARDAGDGPPSGWVRAKSLAEDLPPSITESILGNPQAILSQPEPVQDFGTLGVGPQASIDFPGLADTVPPSFTKMILDNPQALWPQPEPAPSKDLGPFGGGPQAPPQASTNVYGLADTPPESLTESIVADPGRYYQPPEPGPEPQPELGPDKGLDR